MSRAYLAIGAAIVLAGLAALYVAMQSTEHAAAGDVPSLGGAGSAPRGATQAPASDAVAPGGTTEHGGAASAEVAGSTSDAVTATEYTIGGVRIRDHRAGSHAAVDVPPAFHAPSSRKIASQLASDVTRHVRAAVVACASDAPSDGRGDKPRIEGQVVIAIRNHQATITSVTVQARDVAEAARDPLKQCVERRATGATTAAGGEAELEDYAITVSLRLP